MEKGKDTEHLGNVKEYTNLKKEEDDGSWSMTGATDKEGEGDDAKWKKGKGQVRLEGWSRGGDDEKDKWLNM
jgi:hypothetical protein